MAKFPEGFDPDMTYHLRDKDPPTLEEMQQIAIKADANLAEKRARTRSERKVTYRDEVSTSSPSLDPRIDDLVKSMAKMWEKINEKAPIRDNQPNPQIRNRNQNFRREQPQNIPRDNDQQVRPPFNENYVEEDDRDSEPLDEHHLNLIGSDNEGEVYLTEEEQAFFSPDQDETNYEDLDDPAIEFQNAIEEAHMQYDLRSKRNQDNVKRGNSVTAKAPDTILKKASSSDKIKVEKADQSQAKVTQTSPITYTPDTSTKVTKTTMINKIPKQGQQTQSIDKVLAEKAETNISKLQMPFSFEGEIAKIKITMPLTELIAQSSYKSQVLKVLNLGNDANTVNLTDDIPEVLFGPKIEGKFQEGATLPFYISLNIHDQILHNAMLDSGASHNLMPKVVIDRKSVV